jgi:hypothetical protein
MNGTHFSTTVHVWWMISSRAYWNYVLYICIPSNAFLTKQMSITASSHILSHYLRIKAAHTLKQLSVCFCLQQKPRQVCNFNELGTKDITKRK